MFCIWIKALSVYEDQDALDSGWKIKCNVYIALICGKIKWVWSQ